MNSLTDFAIAVYRAPDVQSACLHLQDDFSADIPYLLFLCWYGAQHGRISDDLVAETRRYNQAISGQVIRPLRQARRWMKTQWQTRSALRDKIKDAELQAELALLEELQEIAETAAGTGQSGYAAIEANMRHYLESLPVPADEVIWRPILRAAADAQRLASD